MNPKLHRKARLRFDRHSGGHMIVYPERGLALNETAAAIAKKCDGTRTLDQIVDELVADAGAEARPAVAEDVASFVAELGRKGLLEP